MKTLEYMTEISTASMNYVCDVCDESILKGERYAIKSYRFPDSRSICRYICLRCRSLIEDKEVCDV